MTKKRTREIITIPDEIIMNKIILIRNERIMIDRDLAELYGVTTKRLNEQVKRNPKRFPIHFMFQLTQDEKSDLVANCDHLENLKYSPYLPYAFTEHGTIMLANILNSEKAIAMGIKVVEVFIAMREMFMKHKDLIGEIEKIKKELLDHDKKIVLVFEYLKQFEKMKQDELDLKNRKRIGYKRKHE